MHPELHRTSSRGTMCTGPLRGLVQTAVPRFSWLLLPRVHAADVAATQASPSFTSPAPAPPFSTLPKNIRTPEVPDTGWERIRDLFDRDENQKPPEELSNVVKNCFLSALMGFLYGGLPAARLARQRYIQVSQAEVYRNRVEAVRSAHHAAIRGFLRYGWRWSWRVSLIVTLFSSVTTGLSVFQDKDALSHYVAAGAVTAGLFRLNLGLRGLAAGSVIGAVLGLPVGVVVMGLQRLTGETTRERRRRQRRELYELQLEEWAARLQMTDELIATLNVASQEEETSKDVQRIQELLSSPPNEDVDEDSSS